MAEIVSWAGVIITMTAQVSMANHRFTAIKLLFVGTVIAVAWAIYLQDWHSTVRHSIACILMVRTHRAWKIKLETKDAGR